MQSILCNLGTDTWEGVAAEGLAGRHTMQPRAGGSGFILPGHQRPVCPILDRGKGSQPCYREAEHTLPWIFEGEFVLLPFNLSYLSGVRVILSYGLAQCKPRLWHIDGGSCPRSPERFNGVVRRDAHPET